MPGRDQVEAVPEVAEEGEADGVGRRAVDRIGERAVGQRPLADAQRAHQRLLVADGALVRVGRDDGHVADRVERLLEREEPARLDAVVVGDQDPRAARPLAERPGVGAGPRAAARRAHRPAARRAPCRGRAARSGPAPGSCPAGRRRRRRPGLVRLVGVTRRRSSGGSAGSGSSMSAALPGVGSRGMRTGRPSRSSRRRAARPATDRSPEVRCRKWKKKADTTAAIGIPKIAPGMPAIREPIRTEPRTTIGWMPTAPCMIRGWRTFMTTIQPAAIRMSVGTRALGLEDERHDDRRRPREERPEERDRLEDPAATEVSAASGRPRSEVRRQRDQEVDDAHQRLAAQEAAERARHRRLEQARLLRVGRRDEPEQEGHDLVAVDDHVDRQEEDDQHRADDAQARHRDLLERLDQGRRRSGRGWRGRPRPG